MDAYQTTANLGATVKNTTKQQQARAFATLAKLPQTEAVTKARRVLTYQSKNKAECWQSIRALLLDSETREKLTALECLDLLQGFTSYGDGLAFYLAMLLENATEHLDEYEQTGCKHAQALAVGFSRDAVALSIVGCKVSDDFPHTAPPLETYCMAAMAVVLHENAQAQQPNQANQADSIAATLSQMLAPMNKQPTAQA